MQYKGIRISWRVNMKINVYNQSYDVYLHPSKQKFLLAKNSNDHIVLAEQQIIKKQRGYDYHQAIVPNVLTVFYIPGWKCNMKCIYCFTEDSEDTGNEIGYWVKYIDDYRKKYNYEKINIVFLEVNLHYICMNAPHYIMH